jgi:hypothetical protein
MSLARSVHLHGRALVAALGNAFWIYQKIVSSDGNPGIFEYITPSRRYQANQIFRVSLGTESTVI